VDAYRQGGLDDALAYYAQDCVAEDYPEMFDREAAYQGWEGMRRRDQHFGRAGATAWASTSSNPWSSST
jgi:hypothetical protein